MFHIIDYRLAFATLCLCHLLSLGPTSLEAAKAKTEAQLVCSSQRVKLTHASQLEQLSRSIEQDKSLACSQNTRESLGSLVSLVKNESNKHLCSQEKAEEIVAFYRDIDLAQLHKDLRKIYLAYGLQVSNVCRKSMVEQLTRVIESKELLTEEDFNEINVWTDGKSPIAKLLSEPSDYEDLIIPKHMVKLMKAKEMASAGPDVSVDRLKLFMRTSTNGTIGAIKSVCRRKFKPIYDQLIAPLVTLSSVGFNYKGEPVAREEDINRQVFQWYRIVFMCETLKDVEVLEGPVDENYAKVKVLTTDEARTVFGAETVEATEQPAGYNDDTRDRVNFHANSTGRLVTLDDLLLDKRDPHLVKAIKRHKEPSDRLNSRLNLKLAKFVVSTLKNGVVKLAGLLVVPFTRRNKSDKGAKKTDNKDEKDKNVEQLTKGTYTSEEVLRFFEELKTQIEKKNELAHSKTKKDRFVWRPIRLIINFAVISIILLVIFAVIFSIVSFFGHALGLVAGPLALVGGALAKMGALGHAITHAGAAIKGLFAGAHLPAVPKIPPPHIPPVHIPPVHIPPVHIPPVHIPPVHIPPIHVPPPPHIPPIHVPPVPPVHIPPVHIPPVHIPPVHIPPFHGPGK